MYAAWFGLDEAPFTITPDPRYLYLSARHAEALAHLLYGVRGSGGFIQLTGEVGTGKTTLVRRLLEELPGDVDLALVFNPRLDREEFLAAVCEELRIPLPERRSVKTLVDALYRRLLETHARGRRTVLVVDEAQNLSPDVLEQVRLLTNLETERQKLLQIILIGQPELRELLGRHELRQLAQRITARYHLDALDRREIDAYVHHRLRVAGAPGRIFTPGALRVLYRVSGGIPRLINVICDRALLGAWTRERRQVDAALLRRAAAEVLPPPRRRGPGPYVLAAGLLLAGLGLAALIARPAAWQTLFPAPPAARSAPVTPARITLPAGPADTDTTLRTLFAHWGLDYRPDAGPACRQAAAAGLACVHDRGTWNNLRGLNRPAALSFHPPGEPPFQAVLTGLSADQAELRFGSTTVRVPLARLDDDWHGEFLLLWRPPAATGAGLAPGSSGPGVAWLADSLATLLGRPALAGRESYDAELAEAVRTFQQGRHLRVDGIAGAWTLIHLQNALETPAGAPRLLAEAR